LPRGSLGDVIRQYKEFGGWAELKPKTQFTYERAFKILEPLRVVRLSDMTRPQILKLRNEEYHPKHGRWMANYIVTVLGILFGFAVDQGLVVANPLEQKVKRLRKPPSEIVANRPWTPEECQAVLDAAPAQLLVPVALAMFSGLRKADILSATLSAIRDGEITVRTSKRGVPIRVPLHPQLVAALAKRPATSALQIAITSRGEPWTESGFNASWITFKRRLETAGKIEHGLTIHGLRHTLGTRLREAGADDRTIADVLGQRSLSQARHYSESAGLSAQARARVIALGVTKKGKSVEHNL
jgi:integrase